MRYHFIGIKGSGMSALASIMFDLGNYVQGSDVTHHLFTEDELADEENSNCTGCCSSCGGCE